MRHHTTTVPLAIGVVFGSLCLWGCGTPEHGMSRAAQLTGAIELVPGLRVNQTLGWVEFDGMVAVDCHDPETPHVFLEVIVCSPDTREHESLVVTPVAPSAIHAALLAIGAEPGAPGGFVQEVPVPATGQRVRVGLGTPIETLVETETGVDPKGTALKWQTPSSWIVNIETDEHMPEGGFVFAGSRMTQRGGRVFYDADGAGNIVGLATFGNEVVAPALTFSPEASVEAPVWIADVSNVPAQATPVVVRVTAVREGDPEPADRGR